MSVLTFDTFIEREGGGQGSVNNIGNFGRLTNRWSKAKGDTKYSYDAVGNLTLVDYPVSPDVTFQYDPLNRVTNMVDAVGQTKYALTSQVLRK